METTKFVRKPFLVEAVEVTSENLDEIAELVGDVREDDNGTLYIHVDRRLVPNVYRVYPGFWMTKMGDHIRCYSKKIFRAQFVESTQDLENWIKTLSGANVYEVKVAQT